MKYSRLMSGVREFFYYISKVMQFELASNKLLGDSFSKRAAGNRLQESKYFIRLARGSIQRLKK